MTIKTWRGKTQESETHDHSGKCAAFGCDLLGVATVERMPDRSTPVYCRFHFNNDVLNGEVTNRINKFSSRLNYLHKLRTMSVVDLMGIRETKIPGLQNNGNIKQFLNDLDYYNSKLTFYIRTGKEKSTIDSEVKQCA